MRTNGWQAPMHKLQFATWIVFPVILISFYAFITPFLHIKTSIIFSAVSSRSIDMDSRFENARIQQIYGIVALGIVLSVYHCTSIDPADNSILRPSVSCIFLVHLVEMNAQFDTFLQQMSTPQPTNENQVYCNVCMHYVYVICDAQVIDVLTNIA